MSEFTLQRVCTHGASESVRTSTWQSLQYSDTSSLLAVSQNSFLLAGRALFGDGEQQEASTAKGLESSARSLVASAKAVLSLKFKVADGIVSIQDVSRRSTSSKTKVWNRCVSRTEWQADYKCAVTLLSQWICSAQQGRIAALRFCDVGFSKLGKVVSRVNWASCRWHTHVIVQTCNLPQVVISTITALD